MYSVEAVEAENVNGQEGASACAQAATIVCAVGTLAHWVDYQLWAQHQQHQHQQHQKQRRPAAHPWIAAGTALVGAGAAWVGRLA